MAIISERDEEKSNRRRDNFFRQARRVISNHARAIGVGVLVAVVEFSFTLSHFLIGIDLYRGRIFFPPEAPLRRGGVGRSGRWAKNLYGALCHL